MRLLIALLLTIGQMAATETEEPTRCEACVLLGKEFDDYVMKNKRSESSLIEGMEKLCDTMLQYKLHKDKEGIQRFQKAESQTMETLKELRDRGVQVELGMPVEMWDQPAAEIASLRQLCELIVEQYEDAIEQWYWRSGWDFAGGVCRERVLRGGDTSCLSEHSQNEL